MLILFNFINNSIDSTTVITHRSVVIVQLLAINPTYKPFAVFTSDKTIAAYDFATVLALVESVPNLAAYVADAGLGQEMSEVFLAEDVLLVVERNSLLTLGDGQFVL